ncbi:MAG: hypothetical protein IPL57_08065 [Rubrivivax sp.]|nr:hypothetical protein [Rubrivivax sp.]
MIRNGRSGSSSLSDCRRLREQGPSSNARSQEQVFPRKSFHVSKSFLFNWWSPPQKLFPQGLFVDLCCCWIERHRADRQELLRVLEPGKPSMLQEVS